MYYPNASYPYHRASAVAYIRGNALAPDLNGIAYFQESTGGVLVTACINGLHDCSASDITSAQIAPLDNALFDPTPSPTTTDRELANLSVIFSNKDFVYMQTFADHLTIPQVLNHSFIIHQFPGVSSTSFGTSNEHLAYGVIK